MGVEPFVGSVFGPACMFVAPHEGSYGHFDTACCALGNQVLSRVVVCNSSDARIVRDLADQVDCHGCGVHEINEASVSTKYHIPLVEEGSTTEQLTTNMIVENPMVFNYLADACHSIDCPPSHED